MVGKSLRYVTAQAVLFNTAFPNIRLGETKF